MEPDTIFKDNRHFPEDSGYCIRPNMEKSKRKSLSLREKLDIIDKIEKGQKNQTQISNERDIPRSTVSTIWATRDRIKAANVVLGRQEGCKRLRQPLFEEVDQALYRWCLYAREKDPELSFSSHILLDKASKFAVSLGIENFKCTASWMDRFKQRHGITFRPPNFKKESETDVKQNWFVNDLPHLLDHSSSRDVYAVNEVGLFYQVLPEESQILGGNGNLGNDQKVTLLLGANMDGSDRLPPLVIGNSMALSNLENTDTLSVSYCQDPNSLMTAQIWSDWIHQFDRKMHSMRRKVLLFIDACPSHFVVGDLRSVTVHFVPVTCKHYMPMKQGVMQRFKAWYRKLVLREMVDAINDGIQFQIDILSALHFIRKGWEHISQDCVISSFKLAGWNHDDYQNIESVSRPIPAVSQECYKLNISDSIFEHINQEELCMITREELTDRVICESITAQSGVSVYIDNDQDESANEAPKPLVNDTTNLTTQPSVEEPTNSTETAVPEIPEVKAAVEKIQLFINSLEEASAPPKQPVKMKSKQSPRKKAKVLSLCPVKGVFELQEMKML